MNKFKEIFSSVEHKYFLYIGLATTLALIMDLSIVSTDIISLLFNHFIKIGFGKTALLISFFIILLNVILNLKIHIIIIKFCIFLSKITIKALYAVAAFCFVFALANLIYAYLDYASFFLAISLYIYFLATATFWMLLELENKSIYQTFLTD